MSLINIYRISVNICITTRIYQIQSKCNSSTTQHLQPPFPEIKPIRVIIAIPTTPPSKLNFPPLKNRPLPYQYIPTQKPESEHTPKPPRTLGKRSGGRRHKANILCPASVPAGLSPLIIARENESGPGARGYCAGRRGSGSNEPDSRFPTVSKTGSNGPFFARVSLPLRCSGDLSFRCSPPPSGQEIIRH